MKITLSEKHIKLRLVLTIFFLIVAVAAFTIGVVSIGKKSSGYQTIQAKTDAEALTYNNAVTFRYYLEGKSNQIKRSARELEAVYTPVLASAYKRLDANNVYTGEVSIGLINRNMGSPVSVSPGLYAVLKDAYSKTLENRGYNMFAGALFAEWESIQILDEPDEFDPVNNDFQASRIAAIAAVVSDLSNFKLEFLDDVNCTVRFSVSKEYQDFCKDYEIQAYALDLNNLKDAYMLAMMADDLVNAGYRFGHMSTAQGMVVNTSERGSLGYSMYTLEGGNEIAYATIDIDGVFCSATFTAFGMGSDYGYDIESNGKKLYRHLYFDVRTGEFADILMSATIISHDNDIVENVYQSIIMNTLRTEEAVLSYATSLEKSGRIVSYILQSASD